MVLVSDFIFSLGKKKIAVPLNFENTKIVVPGLLPCPTSLGVETNIVQYIKKAR